MIGNVENFNDEDKFIILKNVKDRNFETVNVYKFERHELLISIML
jgi:hypothetical protein